jgi:PPOX class probable F420-dependent enzyme
VVHLDHDRCWELLARARAGVLSTLHPERGVDAVPVVFAVVDGTIVLPIDTVKPKASTRLRRVANLELDERCVLLVDHYDEEWDRLWWVRAHGRAREAAPAPAVLAALAERYPAYRTQGSIATVLLLVPDEITGWAARPPR